MLNVHRDCGLQCHILFHCIRGEYVPGGKDLNAEDQISLPGEKVRTPPDAQTVSPGSLSRQLRVPKE